jgi:hypothetical protein
MFVPIAPLASAEAITAGAADAQRQWRGKLKEIGDLGDAFRSPSETEA